MTQAWDPARSCLRSELRDPYVAPQTPLEEALTKIWSEVLHVALVGVHDDFFELGGHSLLAMVVLSRVRSELHIDLSLAWLFECPTINGLVARMATPLEASEHLEGGIL